MCGSYQLQLLANSFQLSALGSGIVGFLNTGGGFFDIGCISLILFGMARDPTGGVSKIATAAFERSFGVFATA